MTKGELIDKIALAIARMEGFLITEEEAFKAGIKWPTIAQRNCNPGNVRKWAGYPRTDGYVDFLKWANYDRQKAIQEGWRVLKVLVGQYIDGKYTRGKSPSLYEMFAVYAPSQDGNNPKRYAEFVSKFTGIDPDIPLKEVIKDAS